jgi:hypothetical protein
MAGKKQQAPKQVEEDDDADEGWDNVADVDADSPEQDAGRMRDWRDVEKYREMRELRRLVGDDFDFTDVLGEIPIRNGRDAPKAKSAPPPPPQKAKAAVAAPKAVAAPSKAPAPAPKAAPASHKPPPKAAAATKSHAKPAANKPAPKPQAKVVAKPKHKPSKPAVKQKARKR